jgi:hypothetical protein
VTIDVAVFVVAFVVALGSAIAMLFAPNAVHVALFLRELRGVASAAHVPWRFWIPGDPFVSPYRRHPKAPKGPNASIGEPG